MVQPQGRSRVTQAADTPGLDEVKRSLRRLIEENAGIPATEIDDESSIDDDLAMDSMSFLALQVAVEDNFGIDCTADEIVAAKRFAEIAALVRDRIAGIGAGAVTSTSRARRTPRRMKVAGRARKSVEAPRGVRR